MKISTLLFLLSLISLNIFAQHESEFEGAYHKGELLILLHSSSSVDQLINENQSIGLRAISRLSPGMNIWQMAYDTLRVGGEQVRDMLAASHLVQLVQFNHSNIRLKSNTPNDSVYSLQWDMDKISATQAWAIDTGGFTKNGTQIVLASIDGGFDMSHPDLNPWHNQLEIPGNGIDDDGNGYIDDYRGWNTDLLNDSITLGTGHGTNTMGISSAHGNNLIGISGVNWDVKAMPIVTNIYSEASVISAYTYVFTQRKLYNQTNGAKGAFIVSTNSSFGPSGYGYQYPLWNAMYDSMGTVGILSAGATSNDPNCDVDTCPDIPSQCASRYTVIVTGTNAADTRHGGYGPLNVDLAAPGNGSYTILSGGGYGGFGGTSAASPHVAGAIALMWSVACPKMLDDYKLYPDSMAIVMKRYLLAGVDSLPLLVGKTVSGGRLNLFKALSNVLTYDCRVSGIDNIQSDANEVSIYPNPSSQAITIDSKTPVKSVAVHDCLGQEIKSDLQKNIVSLGSVLPGIYMMEIVDIDNNRSVKKIVRQ